MTGVQTCALPIYVQNFTADGKTSNFYAITGNLATNKGTVTYNGLTLTQCLKIESATNIKFTATAKGKLTLVFAEASKSIKVNGTKYASDSNGIVSVDVNAGSVEITKGDTMNLFYMVYTPDGTTEETHTHNYVSKVTKEATCTEAGVLTYTCTSTTGTCDKKTYTEAIPATGHKFSTEWTIDVAPTDTTPGSKSHHCTVCDAKTDVTEIPATGPVKNGFLKDTDGVWRYYADGKVDTTYTRLARNEWGWFYVNCGVIDRTYTGLADNEWGTWYVKDGMLDRSYTGLVKNGSDWVYVKDGLRDTTYTGLAKNEWGWFYVKDGVYDSTYTGLAKNDWGWFYVKDGALDKTYTGLASNQWGTWYIQNGFLNRDFSGKVVVNGVTYNIEYGLVK